MMNSIQHHPTTELLTAFSAATLPLSQALCISAHIEHCDACRHHQNMLDSIGAELFSKQKAAPISAKLRQQVMAKLDNPRNGHAVDSTPLSSHENHIPHCLRQFIPGDYHSIPWQRVAPSIQRRELCRDTNGAKVELLKIKPGGKVATHTHMGEELTVILEGSFSDEDGLYRTGDFLCRDRRHKHSPIATQDQECICLVVTNAPVQFTGFFTRWLNPLLQKKYST